MNIPDIEFVDTDTNTIKTNIITVYESLSGRTLASGDPIRLFLESIASIIAQQRAVINYTGKMNLLAYATGDYLEHLGVLVGTERIGASYAQATAKITLSAKQQSAVIIPKGTRITAGDEIFFATTEQIIIASGNIEADVLVECTDAGEIGNGYLAGQLNNIVDPIAFVESIINTTETNGGADVEDDDSYRERIYEAPEKFSCAGSDGAYKYYAKSASTLIADIAVTSPNPGEVEIIPLLAEGEIPSDEIVDSIESICSDKRVRPLTDKVTVSKPEQIMFNVNVTFYIDNVTNAQKIQSAALQATDDYIIWQKSKLGRDINPSELIHKMINAGVKRVEVTEPIFTVVTKKQVAIADEIVVTFGGIEDD